MPDWKPRDPSIFPAKFADVVLRAGDLNSPEILDLVASHSAARALLNRFREWRFCLRQSSNPNHRCWSVERDYHIASRIRALPGGGYKIEVVVNPKRLLSIARLNPGLGISQ